MGRKSMIFFLIILMFCLLMIILNKFVIPGLNTVWLLVLFYKIKLYLMSSWCLYSMLFYKIKLYQILNWCFYSTGTLWLDSAALSWKCRLQCFCSSSIFIGPRYPWSDLWVQLSLTNYETLLQLWDLVAVKLMWLWLMKIPTQYQLIMPTGQSKTICGNASDKTRWPIWKHLQVVWWPILKTLPEAQRTQGIDSVTWVASPVWK